MAVIDSKQTISNNTSGYQKGIHKSARTMMLDNLQVAMYNKPISSCVRECVSNAIDSIKEKNIAKSILKGTTKVGDHYVSKDSVKDKISSEEDDIYADSEFNAEYYDLNYLDDEDKVTIRYINTQSDKKDQFIITDKGVGLGGRRLEGFFDLGYSTKRLNSIELGGFGLGAKSPLSTGVESFRVISRHNGREYCFDVYSHKVDCVYGRWNEDGTENDFYEFETVTIGHEETGEFDEEGNPILKRVGFKGYYKKTVEKNSLSVIVDVRKHNKSQFFDAVKSQLMYLREDIVFEELNSDLTLISEIPFKADIIYEDDLIVIPRQSYYSRPHFVIKNIGYGLVDYNELDLTVKHASVGIKPKMENVEVTPNRETVIYNSKTRSAVLAIDAEVSKRVEKRIQEELTQTDFVAWMRACNKVMFNRGSSDDSIARMSDLIDKSSLKPRFNENIKFNSTVKGLFTSLIDTQFVNNKREYNYSKGKYTNKVVRTSDSTSGIFDKSLYFNFEAASSRTTSYLAGVHTDGFVTIRTSNNNDWLDSHLQDLIDSKVDEDTFVNNALLAYKAISSTNSDFNFMSKQLGQLAEVISVLKVSVYVMDYNKVAVPEDYKAGQGDEDGDTDSDFEEARERLRKERYKETVRLRRENKEFIISIPANKSVSSYNHKFGFINKNIRYSDMDFSSTNYIYGTTEDNSIFEDYGELLRLINPGYRNYERELLWTKEERMLRVAKGNLKFFKSNGQYIRDYVFRVDDDGTFVVNDTIRKMLTASFLSPLLDKKCRFLNNFAKFSPEAHKEYAEIRGFISTYNINFAERSFNSVEFNLIKQLYSTYIETLISSDLDEETLQNVIDKAIRAAKAECLDLDIINVDLIDETMINRVEALRELDSVYGSILNYVKPLTNNGNDIPSSLENEVREILNIKKDRLSHKFEGIN